MAGAARDLRTTASPSGAWRGDERGVLFGAALALAGLYLAGRLVVRDDLTPGVLVVVAAILLAAALGGFRPGVVATIVSAVGVGAWLASNHVDLPLPVVLAGLALLVVAGFAMSIAGGLRFGGRLAPISRLGARTRRTDLPSSAVLRLAATQRVLERLASATTASQVGDVVFTDAVGATESDAAAIVTLTPDGRRARVIGWSGRWTEGARELGVHALGSLADVILLGSPIWQSSAPGADAASREREANASPSAGETPFADPPTGAVRAMAIVPLRGRQSIVGAIGFAWHGPRPLPDGEREFIASLGRHVGAALDRANLLSMEQGLRRDAESTRREALRLRDELAAVLQSIREPVFVVAPDGAVTIRNRAAEALLPDVGSLRDLARRLSGPRGHTDLIPGRRVEATLVGTDRVFEVDVAATEGGSGTRIVSLRDVTDDRRAIEAKDAFIGVLSHELRTPVTTILGGIDLLRRGLPEPVGQELLEDVAAETERLRKLIEDLLILSRFERDALEIESEPILAQRLLKRAASAEAARREPPATVRVRIPSDLPPVAADPTYLEQVVRNLIANAVKYGADHGPVEVIAASVDDHVTITVADRGPGFPPEDAERLFELFYRSRSTAAKPGAGIGLFVARQLAGGMGGQLRARPREGGGAEFVLTLRSAADQEATSERPAEAPAPGRGAADARPARRATGRSDDIEDDPEAAATRA